MKACIHTQINIRYQLGLDKREKEDLWYGEFKTQHQNTSTHSRVVKNTKVHQAKAKSHEIRKNPQKERREL